MRMYAAGFVRRKFIWPLLFAPLWGTLFISFGLGPILTRTQVRDFAKKIWPSMLYLIVLYLDAIEAQPFRHSMMKW